MRKEVFYSGRVQGVGFRYTTQRIARRQEVTGSVRNLPDGRVHLVLEGTPQEVKATLTEIAAAMEGCIERAEVSEPPATGEFSAFTVQY